MQKVFNEENVQQEYLQKLYEAICLGCPMKELDAGCGQFTSGVEEEVFITDDGVNIIVTKQYDTILQIDMRGEVAVNALEEMLTQ
jgi:hypothetical protein